MQKQQQIIVDKYGAPFTASGTDMIVGVADNVLSDRLPLNGLRHVPTGNTTGWYIWAGEDFSEDEDFFKPMHISHLLNLRPEVGPYLGLGEGWRFLIDPSKEYEDVWFDKSLLNI